MILLAVFLGMYSYIIFFLGLCGLLYRSVIFISTVCFIFLISIFYFFRYRLLASQSNAQVLKEKKQKKSFKLFVFLQQNKFVSFLLLLFLCQVFVNLMGALGPELAFDALWYHLTLPKIFLAYHTISFLPGGLFNYSVMPKLGEMYYVVALAFGNEILAKYMHFVFGILICLTLFQFSKKFFDWKLSLLAVVIFYSNLVVDWESITAYTDLIRAFFELTSLVALVTWMQTKKISYFVASAILLGFAITAKILAIGSLAIFCVLIAFELFSTKRNIIASGKYIISFVVIAMIIPSPWLYFAFYNTGNPLYPIFSQGFGVGFSHQLLNPIYFVQNVWGIFAHASDPLSPIYIIVAPLIIMRFAKQYLMSLSQSVKGSPNSSKRQYAQKTLRGEKTKKNMDILVLGIYAGISVFVWYITPDTGGGRFILSYLPVYSILVTSLFTYTYPKRLKQFLLTMVIFIAIISIGYRAVANKRYLPVLVGQESKATFLANNLNFSFGDFSDTDGYLAQHIHSTDCVLLYGFHNEFYIDFPFIDSSFAKKGDRFDYIAIQHGTLPKRFYNWVKIYHNTKTDVSLYQSPKHQWTTY